MKRKHRRTVDNIVRLNGATHWSDVEALLIGHCGAEVHEGAGSTATFIIDGVKLTVDRPHSRKECGRGLVKRVRVYLEGLGHL
jgi:hypothetical protein